MSRLPDQVDAPMTPRQLAKPQILIGELGAIFLDSPPFYRLLQGTPAIETRTHTPPIPALADKLFIYHDIARFRLEVWQLQFFP